MDLGSVLSIVLGGVITLIVSLVFYWRASADLQHKVAALDEHSRRLEFLVTVVAGAMENRGLIAVDRDGMGRITGLSVTVHAPAASIPMTTPQGAYVSVAPLNPELRRSALGRLRSPSRTYRPSRRPTMSVAIGPDSVESILRQRGQVPTSKSPNSHEILLPTDRQPPVSGEEYKQFMAAFARASFRKMVRMLIHAPGGLVALDQLRGVAGPRVEAYTKFLVSLGAAEKDASAVKLTRPLDNIGPSLEWYVYQLIRSELNGSAAWGVQLEDLRVGGDFDVLAWLPPVLVYVETKSAHPSQISEGELRNFLQRTEELAPEVALLLVDTDAELTPVRDRLNGIIVPLVRKANKFADDWEPDKPLFRAASEIVGTDAYPGVYFGQRRIFLTNSEPSILAQLQRSLRFYHAHVKQWTFYSPIPVNLGVE